VTRPTAHLRDPIGLEDWRQTQTTPSFDFWERPEPAISEGWLLADRRPMSPASRRDSEHWSPLLSHPQLERDHRPQLPRHHGLEQQV